MVGEKAIEEVLDRHEQGTMAYEALVAQFQEDQPVVMSWLFSDQAEALTRDERDYLLYLLLIIWQAIRHSGAEALPKPDADQLSEREEANWSLLAGATSKRFHERLDVFFQDSPEEDLLAFAEDALSDHEDGHASKEGREAMFVLLKTAVDLWTGREAGASSVQ